MATSITPPTSLLQSQAYNSQWVSKNNDAIAPSVYNKMFKNFGKGVLFFDFLNIPERKVYIPNADVTTLERQFPERQIKTTGSVATGAAGGDVSIVLDSTYNFDANGNQPVRVGDDVVIPSTYQPSGVSVPRSYRVMSLGTTSVANDTLTCRPYSADGTTITASQITTAIPTGTFLMIGSNSWAPGTGQPASMTDSYASRTHRSRIIKETVKIEGGTAAQNYYKAVEFDMGGGQKGLTSKAILETEFRLDGKVDKFILQGELNDNAALTGTSNYGGTNTIKSGYGMWQWLDQLAQPLDYTDQFQVADFDDVARLFESQGVVATRANFCMGPELFRQLENSGLNFIKEYSGGSDLLNAAQNRLGLTINVIRKGDVEFSLNTFQSFSNPSTMGLNNGGYAYQYPNAGVIIPEENVEIEMKNSHYNKEGDHMAAGKYTFPNMFLSYVNQNGENRERFWGWKTGPNGLGIGGDIVSDEYDGVEYFVNSHVGLIMAEVNKMVFIRKS